MRTTGKRQEMPELKELVREASEALARMDAERLEELTRCCQALNRDSSQHDCGEKARGRRRPLAAQAREAAGEFAIFTRVLAATRANLDVMQRLRSPRGEQLEY